MTKTQLMRAVMALDWENLTSTQVADELAYIAEAHHAERSLRRKRRRN